MLRDHLHTRVGESHTYATGTDCCKCVLKVGNLLYVNISVISTAVRTPVVEQLNCSTHWSTGLMQLWLVNGSDPLIPGTDWSHGHWS